MVDLPPCLDLSLATPRLPDSEPHASSASAPASASASASAASASASTTASDWWPARPCRLQSPLLDAAVGPLVVSRPLLGAAHALRAPPANSSSEPLGLLPLGRRRSAASAAADGAGNPIHADKGAPFADSDAVIALRTHGTIDALLIARDNNVLSLRRRAELLADKQASSTSPKRSNHASTCPPAGCSHCRPALPSAPIAAAAAASTDADSASAADIVEQTIVPAAGSGASKVPTIDALLLSGHVIAKSGSLATAVSPAVVTELMLTKAAAAQQQAASTAAAVASSASKPVSTKPKTPGKLRKMADAAAAAVRAAALKVAEAATAALGGKRSVSHFRLTHLLPDTRQALFEVDTETGRKHQLRVQFSGMWRRE
jgi:hypothetical protein